MCIIDSCAGHSFASMKYVKRLARPPEKLSEVLSTVLPSGEILYSDQWIKRVHIYIDGKELYVNLVMLEMHDYEVILGMEWLSKYNATIDCKKKTVTFKPSKEDQFVFIGTLPMNRIPIISTMKAMKFLKNGGVGYLARIIDTSLLKEVKPEDVPVVKEFIEVFLEDLPGLPSDREIEFLIELLLVYSWSKDEHGKHLRLTLEKLREKKLYKFKKCEFQL
ncbi:uncharacterized protein LOC133785411 [Humulus lupulus]|uniref:uncharacterized protein LOC133785411 n=1 Tax=Humulus lupulus TaxID=3486 RepID=UPI002B402C2C|nr:uncharacterized protein LOC133785411 [Humulus lupulus]